MLKRIIPAIAVALGLLGVAVPAQARTTGVAPITCYPSEDSCVLDFVGNGGNGYWMARQTNGSTWVRLTLVPGWSTSGIPPITCRDEDSCVLDYVGLSAGGSYWRARQDAGTTWVRLTLVNGA